MELSYRCCPHCNGKLFPTGVYLVCDHCHTLYTPNMIEPTIIDTKLTEQLWAKLW